MRQIIAIGGGSFMNPMGGLRLERYILSQTKQQNPSICFLPQASNEDASYVTKFYETFLQLDARPRWVSLFGRVTPEWKDKLISSDIIYVGGGNTKSMLALWREWGVIDLLKEAYQNKTILCGVSAGAICWFEQAITDSVWPLGAIEGLGFLKGSACPHFDSEPERPGAFKQLLLTGDVNPGIALEDFTAAHYIDEKLHRVVASVEHKSAYTVTTQGSTTLPVHFLPNDN